jgi:hypothetical protein
MSQQQNLLNTIRAGMANGEHQTATINAGWSALFLGAFYFLSPASAAAGIFTKAAGDMLVYKFLIPHRSRLLAVDGLTATAIATPWFYQQQFVQWFDPVMMSYAVAGAVALQIGRLVTPLMRSNHLLPH